MITVAFDTETALFRPGVMAPELACVTWQIADGNGHRNVPQIIHASDAERTVRAWLEAPGTRLVGHNVQYDVAVLMAAFPEHTPLWYAKYDADRVTCTKWREVLLDTALGCYRWRTKSDGTRVRVGYDLDSLMAKYMGRRLDKDTWRLRYGEFIDVPLADWPEGARTYPLEDARATLDVYRKQEEMRAGIQEVLGADPLKCEFHEARSYLALQLASVWGLRTDPAKVGLLELQVHEEIAKVKSLLVEAGLVRKDGTRDTKAAAARMLQSCLDRGVPHPKTAGGGVALDADACEATEDDILIAYARYSTLGTLLSKDVSLLRKGVEFPVHTNFGFAESGRTTSSSPNIQNFARSNG